MKKCILILVLFLGVTSLISAQKTEYNTDDGYLADGYDVVAYFTEGRAVEGSKKFKTSYDGVNFKFSSDKHLKLFIENPTKYVPAYGGYCAYAMGKKGKKVSIDPETFEIRDGRLNFFYNSWGTNTFKKWLKEGPLALQKKADVNWLKFIQ